MDRVIATNSVPFASADRAPAAGTPQYFTVGNPATPTPATVVPGYFLNMLQDEIRAAITAAGLVPDDTNWAQLAQAIPILANGAVTPTPPYVLTAAKIDAALGFAPVQPSQFAASLTNNGYTHLPNGLIMQWTQNLTAQTNAGGAAAANFVYPLAFPNAVLSYAYTCDDYAVACNTWTMVTAQPTLSQHTIYLLYPGIGANVALGMTGFVMGY